MMNMIDILERSDMIFQLILFVHLFSYRCPKKNKFWGRVVFTGIVSFLVGIVCQQIFRTMWSSVIGVFPLLFMAGWTGYFCYEAKKEWAMQILAVAYLAQNITFSFYMIVREFDPIGSELTHGCIYVLIVFLSATAIWKLFHNSVNQSMEHPIPYRMLAGIFLIAFLIDTMFKFFMVDNNLGEGAGLVFAAWKLMTILCQILLLLMMKWVTARDEALAEQKNLEYILESRKQQYEISKENLEVLKIKLHDVKHMLQNRNAEVDDEMERALNLYTSVVKTDNEVLDTILSEKKLKCEHLGINIEYLIDGGNFGTLSVAEIGVVFGNILDNAIEAVSQIEDPELRVIHLSIRNNGSICSIHEENFFRGELKYENGEIQTSKKDSFLHGLGIKSIRMIVEQHEGTMEIAAEDSVFNMNILLPV